MLSSSACAHSLMFSYHVFVCFCSHVTASSTLFPEISEHASVVYRNTAPLHSRYLLIYLASFGLVQEEVWLEDQSST